MYSEYTWCKCCKKSRCKRLGICCTVSIRQNERKRCVNQEGKKQASKQCILMLLRMRHCLRSNTLISNKWIVPGRDKPHQHSNHQTVAKVRTHLLAPLQQKNGCGSCQCRWPHFCTRTLSSLESLTADDEPSNSLASNEQHQGCLQGPLLAIISRATSSPCRQACRLHTAKAAAGLRSNSQGSTHYSHVSRASTGQCICYAASLQATVLLCVSKHN